jgi:class 3 adenylate cyclase
MNLAARLETSCPPGRIHVSADTCALLPEEEWEPVGGVELKGQGKMVRTVIIVHCPVQQASALQ